MNRDPDKAFIVTRAKCAKGMMAVHPLDNREGLKGRTARLCEHLKGRWTHRDCAYLMSPRKVERLKQLYADGWDAGSITGELYPPSMGCFS